MRPSLADPLDAATLGHFLRAHRDRVLPEGMGDDAHRRVRGLRRSEIAARAGVSVDYYARLEQGRQSRASEQVLEALADALALNPDERHHLHAIGSGVTYDEPAIEVIHPSTAQLIRTLGHTPVVLLGRGTRILFANPAARFLFADFHRLPRDRRYAVLWLLTDPDAERLHESWRDDCRQMVALLQRDATEHHNDPDLRALVTTLGASSPLFRELWSEHNFANSMPHRKVMLHDVGRLDLSVEAVTVTSNPDQCMYVFMPRWGDDASERFETILNQRLPLSS